MKIIILNRGNLETDEYEQTTCQTRQFVKGKLWKRQSRKGDIWNKTIPKRTSLKKDNSGIWKTEKGHFWKGNIWKQKQLWKGQIWKRTNPEGMIWKRIVLNSIIWKRTILNGTHVNSYDFEKEDSQKGQFWKVNIKNDDSGKWTVLESNISGKWQCWKGWVWKRTSLKKDNSEYQTFGKMIMNREDLKKDRSGK